MKNTAETETITMTINPLATYPFPYEMAGITQITPFTVRDGATYLRILEQLRHYVFNITPEFDKRFDLIIKQFQEGITNAENTIVESQKNWQKSFDDFMADIVVQLEGLNDEAVAGLVDQDTSKLHVALIKLFPTIEDLLVTESGLTSKINGVEEKANAIGDDVASRLSPEIVGNFAKSDSGFNTTKVGKNTVANNVTVYTRNNEAFGSGALASLVRGRYNTAVGLDALYSLNGGAYPDGSFEATRNTAIGSNTQRFNKIAWNNVSLGRNTLQCNVTGIDNVSIGSGSMAGNAHIGFSGEIENFLPLNIRESVGVGTSTLDYSSGEKLTAIGYRALRNSKLSVNNTAIGHSALTNLDSHVGHSGTKKFPVSWAACPYTVTNNVLTVTRAGHGLKPNFWVVTGAFTGTENQFLKVSSVTTNNFTLDTKNMVMPDSSGIVNITEYWDDKLMAQNRYNVAVGNSALANLKGDINGVLASSSNTAVGLNSLSSFIDGSPAELLGNSSGLGANTKVSGNNQIQLGTENETVYTFQALQLRSDIRDKTDIRDTVLGLEFINKLRAVDYRWNSRGSYLDFDDNGVFIGERENDGSETKARYHHGLIAQEVESVIKESGIDFGGFQDHKVNGGKDVLTIGYEELIAPLIKAVQELTVKVKNLEEKS